mgnify:CR=1 FL=1
MLKKFCIAVAIIIALPFIIALFVSSSYEVEREVLINKPKSEVFNYVKYLKNQDYFSKWAQIDPEMKKTSRDTDGAVGFVSAWESEHPDVGTGEQEIMAIVDGQRIDYELRFLKPFESISPAYMTFESDGSDQTTVKWGFKGQMDYPMNIMLLMMDFEQLIGDDLQMGLDNLKVIQETE